MLFGMLFSLATEAEYKASLDLTLVEVLPDPSREKTLPGSFGCYERRGFEPHGRRFGEVRTNVICSAFVLGAPIAEDRVQRARDWETATFDAVGCYFRTTTERSPFATGKGAMQRKTNRLRRRSNKASSSAFDSGESCVPNTWSWEVGEAEQLLGQTLVSTRVERVEADWETAIRMKRDFGK